MDREYSPCPGNGRGEGKLEKPRDLHRGQSLKLLTYRMDGATIGGTGDRTPVLFKNFGCGPDKKEKSLKDSILTGSINMPGWASYLPFTGEEVSGGGGRA